MALLMQEVARVVGVGHMGVRQHGCEGDPQDSQEDSIWLDLINYLISSTWPTESQPRKN